MTYKSHVLRILRGRRQRKIRIKLGWNHKSEFQNLCFNVCVNELFHNTLQLSTYTGSPVRLTELKFLLSLSAKQYGNPYFGEPLVYQDLSICHDWSVKEDIVDLPIRLKGIRWVHLGPRTRILGLLCTRVRFICDSG